MDKFGKSKIKEQVQFALSKRYMKPSEIQVTLKKHIARLSIFRNLTIPTLSSSYAITRL